ncbi:hypothetical protein N7456_008845 [Penicillium angulare]|uniref:RTA-like protein n=1 Tax=Penicillium angulare TaxID=116970 RepID=A0A9W9K4Q0_9EURO|nr:hypothetical protein N7456_008845 [Penicillium angulare]
MASSTTTTASASATATCLNISPGKNGYLPPESCDVILYYVPSFGAAIFFCVLFGLTTMVHLAQAIIYKKLIHYKGYAWVIIVGSAWELLAFVFRALQTRHQESDLYDTMYTLFFLLAPIWINAFLYMTLGRMNNFFLPDKKFFHISARRLGTVFVFLDIFAFLVQAAGAVLSSNQGGSEKTVMMGVHIYMGGIGLQEVFILCFTTLAVQLHRTMIQMESRGESVDKLSNCAFSWRWMFYSVYFALGMITIRIIFRIGQYAQGTSTTNPVLTHEAYEYVFDAAPMFLCLLAINLFHPGRNLQGEGAKFEKLSRAQKKEKKRLAKLDKEGLKEETLRTSDDAVEVPLQAYGDREHSPERPYGDRYDSSAGTYDEAYENSRRYYEAV